MEIDIRRATEDDYEAVCHLFDETNALHHENLPQIFQKPADPAWERSYYSGLFSGENTCFFIAQTGGTFVGLAYAEVNDAPAAAIFVPRRYAHVESIVVRSEYRNQGVGRMLMDKMQDWAIAQGATSIRLNVYEFNQAAISFYEELGYQTLSRWMSKDL